MTHHSIYSLIRCKTYNWNRMGENIAGKEKSLRASIRDEAPLSLYPKCLWGALLLEQ